MGSGLPDQEWLLRLADLGGKVRGVARGARVWKEECAFSFLTAESAEEGLFLNLSTLQVVSSAFCALDYERTGNELYLRIKHRREAVEEAKSSSPSAAKKSKLAIGVEGGFSAADEVGGPGKLVKEYALCIFPELDVALPYPLPAGVSVARRLMEVLDAVIASEDAGHLQTVAAWDAGEEVRPVSKFATRLEQVPGAPRVSPDPKTWRCAVSGQQDNLWLNLSTGYIGSGRRNWDGTGGCGAALAHFEQTGRKYPLCVKLGTISADGAAEVYSYDPSEDCMVQDPLLAQHLAHFGINMAALKKTDKTMLELEIELNENLALSAVLEQGEALVERYGPGCVGLFNLGNSCYCNSVLQVLFSLGAVRERFLYGERRASERWDLFARAPAEPQVAIETQLVKLAAALSDPAGSGVQRQHTAGGEGDAVLAVSPKMLRDALGAGHADFGGREQQDAREYLQFLLDKVARMERAAGAPHGGVARWFSFLQEERLECLQSGKVGYRAMLANVLMLAIPMDLARPGAAGTGAAHDELPTVSFDACLKASLGDGAHETLDDYLSPATRRRGQARKTATMETFPKYLAVQLKRYVVGDDWAPKKIECKVPVPRTIDLAGLRARGRQPGEETLPDADEAAQQLAQEQQQLEPDEGMLAQLVSMGFSENGCAKALIAVSNAGVEPAMEWVMQHMEDADFDKPPVRNAAPAALQAPAADPSAVAMLASMGFSEPAAKLALQECGGDLERGADWLFSHSHEIDALLAAKAAGAASGASAGASAANAEHQALRADNDGGGRYALRAFISHLGKTTTGGHYLCHVNKAANAAKDEDWVVFNDRKVASSKHPPLEHGFLYLFERL